MKQTVYFRTERRWLALERFSSLLIVVLILMMMWSIISRSMSADSIAPVIWGILIMSAIESASRGMAEEVSMPGNQVSNSRPDEGARGE